MRKLIPVLILLCCACSKPGSYIAPKPASSTTVSQPKDSIHKKVEYICNCKFPNHMQISYRDSNGLISNTFALGYIPNDTVKSGPPAYQWIYTANFKIGSRASLFFKTFDSDNKPIKSYVTVIKADGVDIASYSSYSDVDSLSAVIK